VDDSADGDQLFDRPFDYCDGVLRSDWSLNVFEIHYNIDGIKRWINIRAKNRGQALSKLYAKHSDRYVMVLGVF
jgi:hypothetical protein